MYQRNNLRSLALGPTHSILFFQQGFTEWLICQADTNKISIPTKAYCSQVNTDKNQIATLFMDDLPRNERPKENKNQKSLGSTVPDDLHILTIASEAGHVICKPHGKMITV